MGDDEYIHTYIHRPELGMDTWVDDEYIGRIWMIIDWWMMNTLPGFG
jgi:hypothetical protein